MHTLGCVSALIIKIALLIYYIIIQGKQDINVVLIAFRLYILLKKEFIAY
jgi:hypothetical protein